MESKTGVLLVNLGTPNSPQPRDVYRYLIEFLTDDRVIDLPWLRRHLLVRGMIVPFRYRQSARAYQKIWTEDGSPLMIYGQRVQHMLQRELGQKYLVELAMRYQKPSISDGINALMNADVDHLIVLPLFPQYASATTGSVHQRVQEVLSRFRVIPKLTLINHYAEHPALIRAFCGVADSYDLSHYEHVLFSFHGLPERHIKQADRSGNCLKNQDCCKKSTLDNRHCYCGQCYATARAIAKDLNIPQERYTICFQSRLGKDPWLQPYTSNIVQSLAKQGKKNVLVFCPAFVCDCLETIYEIGMEYAEEFHKSGGNKLQLVTGLNDHPLWIKALRELVLENV